MSLGGSRVRNIESQRDKNLKEMRRQETEHKSQIRKERGLQKQNLESQFDTQITQMESKIDGINSQITSMESMLADFPPGSGERKQIEKKIAHLKKAKARLRSELEALKIKKRGQVRLINFNFSMKEKNLYIRSARQKSVLLRRFADQILQAQQADQAASKQSSALPGQISTPGGDNVVKSNLGNPEPRGAGGA